MNYTKIFKESELQEREKRNRWKITAFLIRFTSIDQKKPSSTTKAMKNANPLPPVVIVTQGFSSRG